LDHGERSGAGVGACHQAIESGFSRLYCERLFTTKHTKDTKVSDINIFKLLNFVLFVTFVVKVAFSFWLRLCRAGIFVVNEIR
jgi:hypothetical protein